MNLENLANDVRGALLTGEIVFPSLPDISAKIRAEIERETSNASTIADIIKGDTALTAKVLQAGSRGMPVTEISLEYAVSRIGINLIRPIVDGFLMEHLFHFKNKTLDRHMRRNWDRSHSIGEQMSEMIGELGIRRKGMGANEAFLVGLLSSIGELPILSYVDMVLSPTESPDWICITKAVHAVSGEIGGDLLKFWNFPSYVSDSVRDWRSNMSRDSGEENFDYGDLLRIAYIEWHMQNGGEAETDVPVYLRYKERLALVEAA